MRWQLEEYTLVNHGFGQLNHGLVFTDKADAKNAPLTRPARDCKTEDHSIGDQGHGICFDQMRCEAVAKRVRRDVLCPGFFTAVLSAVWKERMPTYLQAGYLLWERNRHVDGIAVSIVPLPAGIASTKPLFCTCRFFPVARRSPGWGSQMRPLKISVQVPLPRLGSLPQSELSSQALTFQQ